MVPVELDPLDTAVVTHGSNPHVLPLAVLVAIQTASRNPSSVRKRAFLHVGDSGDRRPGRVWRKRDIHSAAAGDEVFIRSHGNDERRGALRHLRSAWRHWRGWRGRGGGRPSGSGRWRRPPETRAAQLQLVIPQRN